VLHFEHTSQDPREKIKTPNGCQDLKDSPAGTCILLANQLPALMHMSRNNPSHN